MVPDTCSLQSCELFIGCSVYSSLCTIFFHRPTAAAVQKSMKIWKSCSSISLYFSLPFLLPFFLPLLSFIVFFRSVCLSFFFLFHSPSSTLSPLSFPSPTCPPPPPPPSPSSSRNVAYVVRIPPYISSLKEIIHTGAMLLNVPFKDKQGKVYTI